MASMIAILDAALVDKIAAGEVIERPANVVKELVDNAIDAGSTFVDVRIEDGGRNRIDVTDDGCGMSETDAVLCVQRYATSKLRTFDDLHRLETLGFRGEALPSIAAVSDLHLVTRRRDDVAGTKVHVAADGGIEAEPCGCAVGTSVSVRNLFAQVPARLKFLRARQTEAAAVYETCMRAALIQPTLRLTVENEQRTVREYLPVGSLEARAAAAFDRVPLQTASGHRDGVRVHASLSQPEHARRGARQLFLYVNGRAIQDRRLARAVALSFGQQLAPGFFPQGMVAIELDPALVDINAHPQKTEVRFVKAGRVFDAVTKVLAHQWLGSVSSYWEQRLGSAGPRVQPDPDTSVARAQSAPSVAEEINLYGRPSGLRLIGHAAEGRYLVAESDDEILLLSREAAARRQLRSRFLDALSDDSVETQQCLFPERIDVSSDTMERIERGRAAMTTLGFELSILGATTVAVRTVPALLASASPAALVTHMLDAMERNLSLDVVAVGLADVAASSTLSDFRDNVVLDAANEERGTEVPTGEEPVIVARWSVDAPDSR